MAKKISIWWIIVFALCFLFSSIIVFFNSKKVDADTRIKIVCSTFPVYDWASHIVGDDSDSIILSMTEKNGINLHYFVPTEIDLQKIQNSNLVICFGFEKEIEAAGNSINRMLQLSDFVAFDKMDLYSADKYHLWLSVKNAMVFTNKIAEEIIALDPANSDKYNKNLNRYLNQLESLESEYADAFANRENCKPLIICDRNPFLWLFADYNVKYYSALPDCNENDVTEPLEKILSLETVNYLTQKMDEADTKYLFKLDSSTDKFAHSVIKDSKNPLGDILTLDTMHAATLSQALKGKSYVKVMRSNLEEMKKAL